MGNLKILTVFINKYNFPIRESLYKDLINNKFFHKNYCDVFLLGIDEFLKIRTMDWIKPKLPFQDYWEMPFLMPNDFGTIEEKIFSYEKMYIDRINHIKTEKIINQIDYCIDLNLDNFKNSIYNFNQKKEYKEFVIIEIPLTKLLK